MTAVDCPRNDPSCTSGDDECHDACESPDRWTVEYTTYPRHPWVIRDRRTGRAFKGKFNGAFSHYATAEVAQRQTGARCVYGIGHPIRRHCGTRPTLNPVCVEDVAAFSEIMAEPLVYWPVEAS